MGKDVEGSGVAYFKVISWHFRGRNPRKTAQSIVSLWDEFLTRHLLNKTQDC